MELWKNVPMDRHTVSPKVTDASSEWITYSIAMSESIVVSLSLYKIFVVEILLLLFLLPSSSWLSLLLSLSLFSSFPHKIPVSFPRETPEFVKRSIEMFSIFHF